MKLRTIANFTTTIPDDTQWLDDEIVLPGGRAIASEVREYLRRIGITCSEPTERDSYGWELAAKLGECRFLIVIQMVDEWILQCEPLGHSQVQTTSTMLQSLSEFLSSDQRFNGTRWFYSSDFEKGDSSNVSDRPFDL
jgi:hypothetical protein